MCFQGSGFVNSLRKDFLPCSGEPLISWRSGLLACCDDTPTLEYPGQQGLLQGHLCIQVFPPPQNDRYKDLQTQIFHATLSCRVHPVRRQQKTLSTCHASTTTGHHVRRAPNTSKQGQAVSNGTPVRFVNFQNHMNH